MIKLNENQEKAVTCDFGPVIVVAGPGSGKTRVITYRISYLVNQLNINPEKILVLSFTRASAKEMKERFLKENPQILDVNFGTLHSLYYKILRVEIDLKIDPDIDDDNESEMDKKIFDEMVTKTYELLSNDKKMLNKWQKKFDYILVDEFQDISQMQYDIVKLLSNGKNNIFVVGDDDQSIYGFRGASPKIMQEFIYDYKNTNIINLNANYRCSRAVLNSALNVISNNTNRIFKNLKAMSNYDGNVLLNLCEDRLVEGKVVASNIKEKLNAGVKPKEIGVLCRNTFSFGAIISECKKQGIKDNEVNITTMHKSKGLEYDYVYIVDVNEGVIPSKRCKNNDDIEEERRLFYVAMTRAKKELYIYAVKMISNRKSMASRFLKELDK